MGMVGIDYPRCKYQHDNCFAYSYNGKCRILTSMTDRKECPFYKTVEQYRADAIKYPHRELSIRGE